MARFVAMCEVLHTTLCEARRSANERQATLRVFEAGAADEAEEDGFGAGGAIDGAVVAGVVGELAVVADEEDLVVRDRDAGFGIRRAVAAATLVQARAELFHVAVLFDHNLRLRID